jgi:hypothetical protein
VRKRSAREVADAARYTKVLSDYPARSRRMPLRNDDVPRHNGAPIGMRLTLRHDSHGLATVVPATSSLFLLLRRSPERGEALLSDRALEGALA